MEIVAFTNKSIKLSLLVISLLDGIVSKNYFFTNCLILIFKAANNKVVNGLK
jgi:hypothetical protein